MNATMDRARLMAWIATGAAKEARERAGWTREQVAEKCGVHVRTVTRWEAEGRMPISKRDVAARYYALLDKWLNTPETLLDDERGTER